MEIKIQRVEEENRKLHLERRKKLLFQCTNFECIEVSKSGCKKKIEKENWNKEVELEV